MEESPLEHLALKAMPSYLKSNVKPVHSGNRALKRVDFVIQCHSFLVTPLKTQVATSHIWEVWSRIWK